jgi:hypothetical protein
VLFFYFDSNTTREYIIEARNKSIEKIFDSFMKKFSDNWISSNKNQFIFCNIQFLTSIHDSYTHLLTWVDYGLCTKHVVYGKILIPCKWILRLCFICEPYCASIYKTGTAFTYWPQWYDKVQSVALYQVTRSIGNPAFLIKLNLHTYTNIAQIRYIYELVLWILDNR